MSDYKFKRIVTKKDRISTIVEAVYVPNEVVNQIRSDAIDEFADKLNARCSGMIKDKWNSNVAPISWAEAYADFKDDIDEIAEELKAGGENE